MAELKNTVAEATEEKKVTPTTQEVEAMELQETLEEILTMNDFIKTGIKLKRHIIPKDNPEETRTFYSYFIDYVNRGKSEKAYFAPPKVFGQEKNSRGSYEWLDEVYGSEEEVDFCLRKYSMIDEKTGELKKGVIYYAVHDDEGIIYSGKIKPRSNEDNNKLGIVIQLLKRDMDIS